MVRSIAGVDCGGHASGGAGLAGVEWNLGGPGLEPRRGRDGPGSYGLAIVRCLELTASGAWKRGRERRARRG